ncbi:unnamed protein product [Arabis nemorensis]|uniref:SCP2 domain-containing protein n=1 Tax=Arabis nemorensis TaxID=586526 RepID=A0A565AVU9_9BRAS|nr:unnamed protein product [Arabis nemorensis]
MLKLVGKYEGGKVDATFSFKDDDFVKVATGKMNPQIAFIRFSFLLLNPPMLGLTGHVPTFIDYMGAMKMKGSLSAAQKFTPDIFPKPSKL